jgi:diguanylate cyclase (GGDEF)-like protein/PAS domain S-box-containing protein
MYSEMTVEEITSTDLITVTPHDSLRNACKKMQTAGCGSVLVVDSGKVRGIWTEADTIKLDFQHRYISEILLSDVMSSPVVSIVRTANLTELDNLFKEKGIRHCLVVDEAGQPFGITTKSDLIFNLGVKHYLSLRTLNSVRLSKLSCIDDSKSLSEVVERMQQSEYSMAVLTDGNGIERSVITQRGLVQLVADEITHLRISDVSTHPIVEVNSSVTLLDALHKLQKLNLRCLIVKDNKDQKLGYICMKSIHETIEREYTSQLRDLISHSGRALEESAKHLNLARRVIEASLNSIMITDVNDKILSINPAFSRVTGYSAREVVGENPRILNSGHHDKSFYKKIKDRLNTRGNWQGEIWNRRKDGEIFPEWLSITAIADSKGNVCQYASIFTDLTQQKMVEEQVHKLAHYDELTGLLNRQMFNIELDMALSQAQRYGHKLAVLTLDIDLFNQINDSLGHTVGDQLLVEFAKELVNLAGSEGIVSRLGGDTFSIILPKIFELEDTLDVISDISGLSEKVFQIKGRDLLLTTSMGISVYPEDGSSTELMVQNANVAMHKVKDMGRNGYQFYTSSMSSRTQDRLDMQSRLQIAARANDFFLYYQPKFDLSNNNLVSYEALIRWNDSKLGLVSPEIFIPLIEQMGLIEEVSLWVLKEACQQNQKWIQSGVPPHRMAVNISALHIKRGDVVRDVKKILAELDYPAELLELEITESAFIDGVDDVSAMLSELRDIGISIAIDDFGTGYSSLSYLKKIPADVLKIDASFIKDLTENRDDQQIVQAIIAMAHSLDLLVIAEGVETAEQARFLTNCSCDMVQGFLYSKPLQSDLVLKGNFNNFATPEIAAC